MILDYYTPETINVNSLLQKGIAAGAFIPNVGWSYKGLIDIAVKYGLTGSTHDLSSASMTAAFSELNQSLKNGPVIASVHYKFNPKSPLPHLVVINGVDNDTIYYNDPAGKAGEQKISAEAFKAGWKKRFIVIRPSSKKTADA